MSESTISEMRALRERCRDLNGTVASDYRAYFDRGHRLFFRLPSARPTSPNSISVTTSATALMALAQTHSLSHVICVEPADVLRDTLLEQLTRLLSFKWSSSELPQNNAFTAALVVRAAGVLLRSRFLDMSDITSLVRRSDDVELVAGVPQAITDAWRRLDGLNLRKIAELFIINAPDSLRVMAYKPTAPIAYWLVSGAVQLEVSRNPSDWRGLAMWLVGEFSHQISLISADHPALMDPVGMAMAAAACRRLETYVPTLRREVAWFPSREELLNGVRLFIGKQNSAGSWEKYFPLFHYPSAGANHCWHVEVLEAVLSEFPEILEDSDNVHQISHALRWLEMNRIVWSDGSNQSYGWNAGGQLETLANGEPESWATGVVHIALSAISSQLTTAIRKRILRVRGGAEITAPDRQSWEHILDCSIVVNGAASKTYLKHVIEECMIDPIVHEESANGHIDRLPKTVKRSALLFGPPGTGKTRMVRAISEALGWDFVEILPSEFLVTGLEGVYSSANSVFHDLQDLHRAVVFFDEMDALLQRRVDGQGRQSLAVHQQFMTTSMLPHLAGLYNAGRVLFFFATNYFQSFDAAITRAGRFDMLLFVGPNDWNLKAQRIHEFAEFSDKGRIASVGAQLLTWIPATDALAEPLTRATFSETRGLFREACKGKHIDDAITDGILSTTSFREIVENWRDKRFSLYTDEILKKQYEEESKMSEIRW
ncbi:MAG: ATP-binding protein [Isosphaeraceae bacterium]|nr:ATP-binding protein [Isosphaeraceae bacterium]